MLTRCEHAMAGLIWVAPLHGLRGDLSFLCVFSATSAVNEGLKNTHRRDAENAEGAQRFRAQLGGLLLPAEAAVLSYRGKLESL